MVEPIPCRICGCLDDEPSVCHTLTVNGLACTRVPGRPDWCTACASWEKETRKLFPDNAPIEAFCCEYRSRRAFAAAAKRGTSVPGARVLYIHARRMQRKGLKLLADAGFLDPSYSNLPVPPDEAPETPLCPAKL